MFETLSSKGSSAHSTGMVEQARRGGIVDYLAVRYRNLVRRHRIARLEALDDEMLADIGLTRSDLQWARHLNLSHNPLQELDRTARQRSREYRLALARKAVR